MANQVTAETVFVGQRVRTTLGGWNHLPVGNVTEVASMRNVDNNRPFARVDFGRSNHGGRRVVAFYLDDLECAH